jgi:hypothetical protein
MSCGHGDRKLSETQAVFLVLASEMYVRSSGAVFTAAAGEQGRVTLQLRLCNNPYMPYSHHIR